MNNFFVIFLYFANIFHITLFCRMNRTCNKTANEAGYCEICALHYSDLSQHLTTSLHLKFTCNDKNYADLDNCIKTRSVEAFLTAHQ